MRGGTVKKGAVADPKMNAIDTRRWGQTVPNARKNQKLQVQTFGTAPRLQFVASSRVMRATPSFSAGILLVQLSVSETLNVPLIRQQRLAG